MISRLDVIVLLCGVGTFLLRFLPMRQARRNPEVSSASGLLHRLFQGIGPAAITALLVVSLWPTFVTDFHPTSALFACLALLVILVVKRLIGGIAAPALGGAIFYGLLMYWAG